MPDLSTLPTLCNYGKTSTVINFSCISFSHTILLCGVNWTEGSIKIFVFP